MHHVDRHIRRWMKKEYDQAIVAGNLPPNLLAALSNRRVMSAAKMYEMAARECELSGSVHL